MTEHATTEPPQLGENELIALAQAAPIGLFLTVEGADLVLANTRFLEITGLEWDQALGSGWAAAAHPDDRGLVLAWIDAVREGRGAEVITFRVCPSEDDVRWVRVRLAAAPTHPSTSSFVGSMVDITHFKQAEEAVHERERWFRALIENSFDIITVI